MQLVKTTFLLLLLRILEFICSPLNSGLHKRNFKGHHKAVQETNLADEKSTGRRLQDVPNTTPHVLEKAFFIPLDHKLDVSYNYYYIDSKINNETSNHILYPYTVTNTNTGATGNISHGGVFDISNNKPSQTTTWGNMKDVLLSKAKPLYSINIGIFSAKTEIDNLDHELFLDGHYYCDYFTNSPGHSACVLGKTEYDLHIAKGKKDAIVIYLTKEAILNDHLLIKEDGSNMVDLLILTDYMPGKEQDAYQFFSPEVIDIINKFSNNGGTMIVEGKGGYLLEKMGYLPVGTYDTSKTLRTKTFIHPNMIKGCENMKFRTPENGTDFYKHVICMNPLPIAYCVNAYPMFESKIDPTLTLISYSNYTQDLSYYYKEYDLYATIPQYDLFTPYLMRKPFGNNGHLFIFNGNPMFAPNQTNSLRNIYLNAMTRSAQISAKLLLADANPIPAGEDSIEINVDIKLTNYYSERLINPKLFIFFPNDTIEFISTPETIGCTFITNSVDIQHFDAKKRGFNHTHVLECSILPIPEYGATTINLKLNFIYSTTLEYVSELTILQALAYYDDEGRNRNNIMMMTEPLKSKLAKGAMIKADIDNSNPTFYPLPSEGVNQKISIKLQNHQTTDAKSIEYIEVIPLASPIIDANDYSTMGRTIDYYSDYYIKKNFSVPFQAINEEDYLDIGYLNNKGVVLVPEYNQRVKVSKEINTENSESLDQEILIQNVNYSTLIDDPRTILTQKLINYVNGKPESSHRLMCFLDDNGKTKKKEILFARIDIAFDSEGIYNPTSINKNHVFSIDKKPEVEITGKFDRSELISDQKVNAFTRKADAIVVDAGDNAILQSTSKDLKLIHYLIPVKSSDINSAENLEGFTAEQDGTGYQTENPLIKFIRGHTISFIFEAKNNKSQGGKILIKLPTDNTFLSATPIEDYLISYSSDKVSFYKTIYNEATNTIEAFFKSGILKLQNSNIVINIESLKLKESFNVEVELFEMKYDLSIAENDHEIYTSTQVKTLQAEYINFFSLPALEVRISTEVFKGMEIKSPYTEYSLYFQELNHRGVYGSLKSSHATLPGAQLFASSFSFLSKVGTTTKHLSEYITGKATAVPSSSTSSRIEWKDLWGRHWAQPLSSTFTEAPSNGDSFTNKGFSISTSYELINKEGKRVLQWIANEEVELRIKLNLYNNFNKYFEPTVCDAIKIPYESDPDIHYRFYAPNDALAKKYTGTDTNAQLMMGYTADYGKCYKDPLAWMSDLQVTEAKYAELDLVQLCDSSLSNDLLTQCIDEMKLKMKLSSTTKNYSPLVESFYPQGYITEKMWLMNMTDYDNDSTKIGYKWHMDNNLPSLDSSLIIPENAIEFPILKPLEFTFKYNKWYSDNLQNKDHTLLAGQVNSYDNSTIEASPLTADSWVNYKNLISDTAQEKSKNEYVCRFNQHRLKTIPSSSKLFYAPNVYQNNIIPIINNPNNDFVCENENQYTPETIGTYDNREETQGTADKLHFAANLRGEAKETINIFMTLSLRTEYFEGIMKLIDQISFMYKNPLGIDKPIALSQPVAIDAAYQKITMDIEILPKNCYVMTCRNFLFVTITDKNEDEREFKSDSYRNSYGFGDVVTSVLVGEINGSSCKVSQGQTTYFAIQITNNAGFDFNLLKGAIEYDPIEGITPTDSIYLKDEISHIQKPTKINFLSFTIPSKIRQTITIEPSDHLSTMGYDDLEKENFNPTSIKQGKTAQYFFKLKVSSTFNFRQEGVMHLIKVMLNLDSNFDRFIKYNDPFDSIHEPITIPPIQFGVPFNPTSHYAGKVYTFTLQSIPKTMTFKINRLMDVDPRPMYVTTNSSVVTEIRNLLNKGHNASTPAYTYYGYLPKTQKMVCSKKLNQTTEDPNFHFMNISFNTFPDIFFPIYKEGLPIGGKLYGIMMIREFLNEDLPYNRHDAIWEFTYNYLDYNQVLRTIANTERLYINARGPILTWTLKHRLLSVLQKNQTFEVTDSGIYASDRGLMETEITLANTGNDAAYEVVVTFVFFSMVQIYDANNDGTFELFQMLESHFGPVSAAICKTSYTGIGEKTIIKIPYYFRPINSERRLEQTTDLDDGTIIDGPSEMPIIKEINVTLSVRENDGLLPLTKIYKTPIAVPYVDGGKSRRQEIEVKINNVGTFENPILKIKPETKFFKYDQENYKFALYRKMSIEGESSNWEKIEEKTNNDTFTDIPITNALKNYIIDYRIESTIQRNGNYVAMGLTQHEAIKTLINDDDANLGDADKKNIAIILLIVFSVIIFITIILAVIYFIWKSRKNRQEENKGHEIRQVGTEEAKELPTDIQIHKMTNYDFPISPDKMRPAEKTNLRAPSFIRVKHRNITGSVVNLQNYVGENPKNHK